MYTQRYAHSCSRPASTMARSKSRGTSRLWSKPLYGSVMFFLWFFTLLTTTHAKDLLPTLQPADGVIPLPTITATPNVTVTMAYPGDMTGYYTTIIPGQATQVNPGDENVMVTVALPGVLTGVVTVLLTQEQPDPTTLYATHTATVNNQPVTITVGFPYPSAAPGKPDAETFDCKKPIRVGWKDFFTMSRTVNRCYPVLSPTCEREAKASFCKWRDFCYTWNNTMQGKVHESCNNDGYEPDDPVTQYMMNAIKHRMVVKTCCPTTWESWNNDIEWCRIFRVEDGDEWEYYTQNFGAYGIVDEEFIYHLSEENYDRDTGAKGIWY